MDDVLLPHRDEIVNLWRINFVPFLAFNMELLVYAPVMLRVELVLLELNAKPVLEHIANQRPTWGNRGRRSFY